MNEYKLISKEGYNDGYYWDMRYCFELDGKRYILTDIGSLSGYIPCGGEIMEVENDESLDMLLKNWTTCGAMGEPEDLSEEDAIQYVKRLRESGTKAGQSFELWRNNNEYE